jgi:hypothetical protein
MSVYARTVSENECTNISVQRLIRLCFFSSHRHSIPRDRLPDRSLFLAPCLPFFSRIDQKRRNYLGSNGQHVAWFGYGLLQTPVTFSDEEKNIEIGTFGRRSPSFRAKDEQLYGGFADPCMPESTETSLIEKILNRRSCLSIFASNY